MAFKIILADYSNPDHARAIQRLWKDNLRFVAEGRYGWLYQGNPAGGTITCLAVHEETAAIVGAASAMRRNFYLNGKCYTAGIAVDFAIDAEYRVFGPALPLQRALADQAWTQGLDFMLGFPNLASQGVLRRLGYEKVGASIRFTKLIRTHKKITSTLKERRMPIWLARPAAAILDAGLLLRNRCTAFAGTGRVLSVADELDAQWQQMWEKNTPVEGFQGEGGAGYACWRYLRCPYRDYRVFGLFDERQDMVAYLVYTVEDDVALIDDFRYQDRKWLSSLFGRFWDEIRSRGGATISTGLVIQGNIRELMIESGFIPRPSERWLGVLSNPAADMDWKEALCSGDWYITDGEIDL